MTIGGAVAHSTLLETEPARDRVVEHSPERVLLRFDEAVESELGSITVTGADACARCAESCEQFGGEDEVMRACAETCLRCAETCRAMAG